MEKKCLSILIIALLLLSSCSQLAPRVMSQVGGEAPTLMGSGFMWPGPSNTQIDTWDGSLTLSLTEAELPCRVPILIAFTYFSRLCNVFSQYGYGWRFNHKIFYVDNEDETIIVWGNGGAATFVKDKDNGGYVNTPGVTDNLTEYAPHQFVLTTKDGFKFTFSNPYNDHVTQVTDRFGNSILFTYDRFGLLTTISDDHYAFNVTFRYDDDGLLKDVVLPNRHITFAYDTQQNLINIKTLNSTTYETVYQSSYTYDSAHFLTSISDPSSRTASIEYSGSRVSRITSPLIDTQVTYDTVVNKTTIVERTDNIEQTTTLFFDDQGRCLETQDDLGGIVTYEWDGNNIISITDQNGHATRYEYDANRNPVAVTDATGNRTRYTYREGSNDPTSYMDARGNVWNYAYNSIGQMTQKKDPTENSTYYSYDIYGDNIEIDYPVGFVTYDYNSFGAVAGVAYSTGYYLNYSYDASGNLVSVTDQIGNSITYEYDLMNRLVSMKDRQGLETKFSYDAYNNLIKRVDPGNRITLFEYDALDRVTKVTDATGNVTTYNYNAGDHTKTITDPRGSITTFTYDSLNRLINEQDPLGNSTSYTYDAADNVLSLTYADGSTTHYYYDEVNRLVHEDYPDGNQVYYSYDQVGNVISLADSHTTLNYTYDPLNRLIEVKDSTHDKAVNYAYDAMGNVVLMRDPYGKETAYAYDEQGRLASILDPDEQTTEFYYSELGWLAQKHYPNGIVAYYGYNDNGELTDLRYIDSQDQTMLHYIYEYDEAGNLIRADKDGDVTLFSYDSLSRLTHVTYPDTSTVDYAYDACGNRVSSGSSAGTTNYLYNAANQLVQAGDTTYQWDKNGNLIAKTLGGETTYEYNAADELTSIEYPDMSITSYEYYPDGRLMAKTAGTDQTCYIYSGQNVLYETDADWNPTAQYNSVGIDDTVSVKQSGNYYFYLYDYVGSVVAVTDNSEQVVSTCSYDAFGVPSVSGTPPNSHLFINREYDSKSQLYQMRARFYDPSLGRFITKDPLPNYAQPYVYASDNPVMFADPSGFIEQRILELASDLSPRVNMPTSMIQRRQFWEDLATEGLSDPCGYAGYWKYTVGKWESGIISELEWLRKNWKGILRNALGISSKIPPVVAYGVDKGVLGFRPWRSEPIYICLESTYVEGGAGGLHLGVQGNMRYVMKDWGMHIGIPKHVAETNLGKIFTTENFGIIGEGPTFGSSTYHYFPVKAGAQAVILIGFFTAPIIGLKGCDRIKESPIEWNPNANIDVIDHWQYEMYLKSNPYSDGYWDEISMQGTFELVEQGTNITGSADTYYLATIHRPDGSFYYYGPFTYHYPNIRANVSSGNKLDVIFNPEGYDIDHRYWYGLTALVNRISTRGEGKAHYDWNPPEGVAENVSEIRVNTEVLVKGQPDSIEPRTGPNSNVMVVLADPQTGEPISWGGPLTFENYSPEIAYLSEYADLGPQAKITVNAITSGEMKTNAFDVSPLSETYPSGEILIGVKAPHVFERNFSIIVSPTSIWHVAADGSGDFSTIQGAIDAASPGDLISVGYGVYNETVVVDKSLTIDGSGSYPTVNAGGTGNAITITADNTVILGLKIVNSAESHPYSGILLDHVNSTVIRDNEVCENDDYGIFEWGGSNNTIETNQIHDNYFGLRIDGQKSNSTARLNSVHDNQMEGLFVYDAQNVLIDSNSFYHNGGSGSSIEGNSRDITLIDNTFSWNIGNGLSVYDCTNITVRSNEFISNSQFGLNLVESNNNTIQNNKFYFDWIVDLEAPSGDGMYVWNSTSNDVEGNVAIDNWRWLTGKPIVYFENERDKLITNASQVILVNCTNISIKGLNATSVDMGLELWLTNYTMVTDSLFKNNFFGVIFYNSSNNLIYQCNFINNSQSQVHVPNAGFSNIWDNGYPAGGNYWSDYAGVDANHDGIGDTPYVIDSNNQDRYPLMAPWTGQQNSYLVVRGSNNQIFYRVYLGQTTLWRTWTGLPGTTSDPPAAAIIGSELHIVVRGSNNGQIWHGYVNLADNSFSGWELLSGSTPSAPTLTGNDTSICLVVRGSNNVIYYRFYTLATRSWTDWTAVPNGFTTDTPAATLTGNNLQVVVKGSNSEQIWYGAISLPGGSFSGWGLLDGSTPSTPTLCNNGTSLCLMVRGSNSQIYYRWYSLATQAWGGWSNLPAGTTPDTPAATITGGKLQIVVRGSNSDQLWYGSLQLSASMWSGWTMLDGSTPSKPILTS